MSVSEPGSLAVGELPDLQDDDWGNGRGRWSTLGGWHRSPEGSATKTRPLRRSTRRPSAAAAVAAASVTHSATVDEVVQDLQVQYEVAAPTSSSRSGRSNSRSRRSIASQQADDASASAAEVKAQIPPAPLPEVESKVATAAAPAQTVGSDDAEARSSRSWQEIVGRSVWEGIEDLNEELSEYPLLSAIENFTRIPKAYIALGMISLTILLVFFGLGTRIISSGIGYLVPLYTTLCVLQYPELPVLKHLLCYWIFYYVFRLLEPSLDQALSWIPLYYVLKLVFLWWCYSPTYEGASRLYKSNVRSFVRSGHGWMAQSVDPAIKIVYYTWLEGMAHIRKFCQGGIDLVHAKCMHWIEEHDALRRQEASFQRKPE